MRWIAPLMQASYDDALVGLHQVVEGIWASLQPRPAGILNNLRVKPGIVAMRLIALSHSSPNASPRPCRLLSYQSRPAATSASAGVRTRTGRVKDHAE